MTQKERNALKGAGDSLAASSVTLEDMDSLSHRIDVLASKVASLEALVPAARFQVKAAAPLERKSWR